MGRRVSVSIHIWMIMCLYIYVGQANLRESAMKYENAIEYLIVTNANNNNKVQAGYTADGLTSEQPSP